MKSNKGWLLLIASIIVSFVGDVIFSCIGGTISAEAADLYSVVGAICGFMTPSIVYFGNRIK